MKRFIKIFLVLLISLLSYSVYAGKGDMVCDPPCPPVKPGIVTNKKPGSSTTVQTCQDPEAARKISSTKFSAPNLHLRYGKKAGTYSTYIYNIKVNNQIYKGFCIDPGSRAVASSACLTCDKLDESGGYGLLTRQMIDMGWFDNIESDPHRIGIAYRFMSIFNVDNRQNISYNYDLAAFNGYVQTRNGQMDQILNRQIPMSDSEWLTLKKAYEMSDVPGYPGRKFMAGTTTSGMSIDALYDFAYSTYGVSGDSTNTNNDGSGGLGGVTIEMVTDSGQIATMKAVVPATMQTRNYTCEGCEFLSQPEVGYGKTTTFQVKVTSPDCKFKIGVVTDSGGIYFCHEGTRTQQYIVYAPDGEIPTESEFALTTCDYCETNGNRSETGGTVNPDITGSVNNCCDGGPTIVKEPEIDDLFVYDDCYMVNGYKLKSGAAAFRFTDAEGTYDNGKIDPDYCELYCTQRARIDIPGEVSAVNGRYFILKDQTVDVLGATINTTGPVAQGFKRCRLRIKYVDWLKEYMQEIDNEITSYNNYQHYKKSHELSVEVVKNHKEIKQWTYNVRCEAPSVQASCSCTVRSGSYPNYSYTSYHDRGNTVSSDTKNKTVGSFTYFKYNYDNISQNDEYWRRWYEVRLKPELIKQAGMLQYYDKVELEDDRLRHMIPDSTVTWQLYPNYQSAMEHYNAYNGKVHGTSTASTRCCSETEESIYSCEINLNGDEGFPNVNVEGEKIPTLQAQYEAAADAYSAATKNAKILENKLYVCDNYFGQYEGAASGNMFDFDPDSTFYYTQIYLDDLGSLAKSTTGVDFEKVCKQDPTEVPDPGLFENKIGDVIGLRDGNDNLTAQNTSGIFGGGKALMKDFRCAAAIDEGIKTSSYSVSGDTHEGSMNGYAEAPCSMDTSLGLLGKAVLQPTAFMNFLDIDYQAGKQFTMDARYHAYCYWEEQENTKYTLAPYGDVNQGNTNVTIRNYNIHNQHYEVYLTTLEGTFETHWDMSNIGENGVFDEYISQNGTTCAGQTISDNGFSPFTCKLKVTHQLVRTGGCDGVVDDQDHCYIDDTSSEGYMLYSFKVVDFKNIFPVCDDKGSTENCFNTIGYAYNWLIDDTGKIILSEIESGEAFNKDNLTYSFVLSGSDMKKIREYNRIQINSGGYTDYELSCKHACMGENGYTIVNGQVVQSHDACSKCYSDFVGDLANGKIKINGSEQNVSGWGNSQKSLSYVREHNNW